jgi:hypothetical protein
MSILSNLRNRSAYVSPKQGTRQIRVILYAKEASFRASAFGVSHRYVFPRPAQAGSKPLHLNRRLRYYFCGPSSALTLWIVSQWQSAPDEDWALALAREAVIRPLTDQPELTEELVVTASDELGISRSLVYRLVAKFRTTTAGFAVLVLAPFADNHPRAPAKFQRIGAVYDLSTVFPRI